MTIDAARIGAGNARKRNSDVNVSLSLVGRSVPDLSPILYRE